LKSQDRVVEVTVNNKEENSSDFFLDFVHGFGLAMVNTKLDTAETFTGSRLYRRINVDCNRMSKREGQVQRKIKEK
jgi:hypothetical protein